MYTRNNTRPKTLRWVTPAYTGKGEYSIDSMGGGSWKVRNEGVLYVTGKSLGKKTGVISSLY